MYKYFEYISTWALSISQHWVSKKLYSVIISCTFSYDNPCSCALTVAILSSTVSMLPGDQKKKRTHKSFFRIDQDFVAILYVKKSEGFSQSCT